MDKTDMMLKNDTRLLETCKKCALEQKEEKIRGGFGFGGLILIIYMLRKLLF